MMTIGPLARIDLAALRHNLARVRQCAPDSRIWAVIKADAYGHGMLRAAAALASGPGAADGFAVARVEEGLRLREAGVARPILVLEGAGDADELAAAAAAGLRLAIHDPGQLDAIAALLAASPGAFHGLDGNPADPPLLWLKVDTGMGRLGVTPAAVAGLCARLRALPGAPGLGLMTHLANADDPADPLTAAQCQAARTLAAREGLALSIGNSAGIVAHPAARTDWVRPGIMLYGGLPLAAPDGPSASPSTSATTGATDLGLHPVMTLTSRLIAVRERPAGSHIGYGGTYACPEAMPVGVVAIGYGDGYPRHAPTGTPVLIRGQQVPLIGRVSMDMITVDLRAVPAAQVGDEVTLWGAGLPVETIAARVGTINYELLCRLSPRVRLVYQDPEQAIEQAGMTGVDGVR